MTTASNPLQNYLLAALPPDVWERLLPSLEQASLERGQVLSTSGLALSHAYFPTSAVLSTMHRTANGSSGETASAGSDGMVGLCSVMGVGASSGWIVVRSAGGAFRLPAKVLADEFHRNGAMMQLLLRYSTVVMTQMSQRSVCIRHHNLLQQLARALLEQLDRIEGCQLLLTQDVIADHLGVRRESVSGAAGALQRLGIIRNGRGRITVLDRPALGRIACECYGVMVREGRRLLPATGLLQLRPTAGSGG